MICINKRGGSGFRHPAEGIVTVAAENCCDLIVMASHGRHGISLLATVARPCVARPCVARPCVARPCIVANASRGPLHVSE
ncbi:MAG: universal stress protein [Hyphomicrobiales bacterium]|nr:universal stress protein [Hyphomicrobiales bacterium]